MKIFCFTLLIWSPILIAAAPQGSPPSPPQVQAFITFSHDGPGIYPSQQLQHPEFTQGYHPVQPSVQQPQLVQQHDTIHIYPGTGQPSAILGALSKPNPGWQQAFYGPPQPQLSSAQLQQQQQQQQQQQPQQQQQQQQQQAQHGFMPTAPPLPTQLTSQFLASFGVPTHPPYVQPQQAHLPYAPPPQQAHPLYSMAAPTLIRQMVQGSMSTMGLPTIGAMGSAFSPQQYHPMAPSAWGGVPVNSFFGNPTFAGAQQMANQVTVDHKISLDSKLVKALKSAVQMFNPKNPNNILNVLGGNSGNGGNNNNKNSANSGSNRSAGSNSVPTVNTGL